MNLQESLAESLDGEVLARGEDGFENARGESVWNALKPDRYPDMIAVARSTEDVIQVVRCAAANSMTLAIRCGGHNWGATHLRDDGILLDISRLRELKIDVESRTAWVQPGVTGVELIGALTQHQLAFPTGHCPSVALGGYLLAGGLGWNPGVWGTAVRSVRSVEVVTATGELIIANAQENSDLFWAARGGGQTFPGVVTRFEIELHPLPGAVASSVYAYPLSEAGVVARWIEPLARTLAPEVELHILLTATSESGEPQLTVFAIAWADTVEQAASVLEPLERCPAIDSAVVRVVSAPTAFEPLYAMFDAACPEGARYSSNGIWSSDSLVETLPALAERISAAPSKMSLISTLLMPSRSGDEALGVPYQALSELFVLAYAIWEEPDGDDVNKAWTRGTFDALADGNVGRYVGEADLSVAGSLESSYVSKSWDRLAQIRGVRDSGGLFSQPQ